MHKPLKIRIWAIPKNEQRYDTCGDWWIEKDGEWNIRVTNQDNWKSELAVAIHELIEMALCVDRKIDEQVVTNFDMSFEDARMHGHATGEPGDSQLAPYRKEHRFAENIERQVIHELGIHWNDHDGHLD